MHTALIRRRDAVGGVTTTPIPGNASPVWNPATPPLILTIQQGASASLNTLFTDPNGDVLSYTVESGFTMPANLTLNENGTISAAIGATIGDKPQMKFLGNDGYLAPPIGNTPPLWSTVAAPLIITVYQGGAASLTSLVTDADNDAMTFAVQAGFSLPANVTLNANGTLSATLASALGDSNQMRFTANDGFVAPPVVVGAITITPASVSVSNGGNQTFTITRTVIVSGAAITYTLASQNSAIATVPATAIMQSGQNTVTFNATSVSIGNSSITADNGAGESATASISIVAATAATISLTPSPASVTNGNSTQMTITRSAAVTGSPITYALLSSNTAIATVPATAIIAAGQNSITFNAFGVSTGSSTITANNGASESATSAMSVIAPGVTTTTLRVEPAVPGVVGSGWVQAFVHFPQGVVTSAQRVVATGLDTTILHRWPDGSATSALVRGQMSVSAPTTIPITITTAAAPAPITEAALITRNPTCVLDFGVAGVVSLAPLLGSPLRSRALASVTGQWLYHTTAPNDVNMHVYFYVTLFPACVRIKTVIYRSTDQDLTYTLTMTAGGITRTFPSRLHRGMQGWDDDYTQGAQTVAMRSWQDVPQFKATKIVPNHLSGIAPAVMAGLTQQYTPLGFAPYYPDGMGAYGDHISIGYVHYCSAFYLASDGDRTAHNSMIAAARSSRSVPYARIDPVRRLAPLLSANPGAWYGSAIIRTFWMGGGASRPVKSSHSPEQGAIAYLVSGDDDFMDHLAFIAFDAWAQITPNLGLGTSRYMQDQERSMGWASRHLSFFARFSEDTAMKAEIKALLEYNIEQVHDRFVNSNLLGVVYGSGVIDQWTHRGVQRADKFEGSYLRASYAQMWLMGHSFSPTTATKLRAFIDWHFKGVVDFVNQPGAGWLYPKYMDLISQEEDSNMQAYGHGGLMSEAAGRAILLTTWQSITQLYHRNVTIDETTGIVTNLGPYDIATPAANRIMIDISANYHTAGRNPGNWRAAGASDAVLYHTYTDYTVQLAKEIGIANADVAYTKWMSASNQASIRSGGMTDPRFIITARNA